MRDANNLAPQTLRMVFVSQDSDPSFFALMARTLKALENVTRAGLEKGSGQAVPHYGQRKLVGPVLIGNRNFKYKA
jgi:hypothetical protein